VDFAAHQLAHITRDPLAQRALKLLPDDFADQVAQRVLVDQRLL